MAKGGSIYESGKPTTWDQGRKLATVKMGNQPRKTFVKLKLETQGGTKGEKVLGVALDFENDTLHFNFVPGADKAKGLLEGTKRDVFSLLASLFDPLRIVSPVTVRAKILLQEICNSKLEWDKALTGEIRKKWDKWVQDLSETKEIDISWCLYDMGERV